MSTPIRAAEDQEVSAIYQRARSKKNLRIALVSGGVGTALEQFDFASFGLATALVFPTVFFPGEDPLLGALKSFMTMGVGFLARPIGGIVFSHFGERLGRKWVMVCTLALMGTATALIGVIPSYSSIGLLAPALLVLMRILQGLGAGAEQAGSATLLTETAPNGKRGRMSSTVMMGAAAGTAFGALVFAIVQWIVPAEAFLEWGWRIVFLFSILVTLGAFIIRRNLDESPVFSEMKANVAGMREEAAPVKEAVAKGWKRILQVFFMNWGPNGNSYIIQTFVVTYLTTSVFAEGTQELFPKSIATNLMVLGALVGVGSAYCWGRLSDKVGRKPVYIGLCLACVILPFGMFPLLNTGQTAIVAIGVLAGMVLLVWGPVGVQMSYFPELFGSRYRYAGVTLAREFSSVIGGGLAPMICAWLLAKYGSWWPLAIYMALTMIASLVATITVPETIGRDLTTRTDAIPGEARKDA